MHPRLIGALAAIAVLVAAAGVLTFGGRDEATDSSPASVSDHRTGCFCNPGAGEVVFAISRETLVGGEFGEAMTLDDYVRAIGLPSGGAVRASLGLASNAADLDRFIAFAREFVDLAAVPDDLPPRSAC